MNENVAAAAVVLTYVGFKTYRAIKASKAHQERMEDIRNLEDNLNLSIDNLRENLTNPRRSNNQTAEVTVIDITREQ